VLAESLAIAALGGALGLGLASVVAQRDLTGGIIPTYLSAWALAGGALVALVTGAIAGTLPALGAMRLQVAAALRRV
jgi:ABC-type antimicrobial peptide transport system permease subunit